MSIMSDARLRLLEARVAELERRLAEPALSKPETSVAGVAPKTETKTKRKSAPKPRKPNRKSR